jgi:2-aminoadipate transaminase
VTISLARGIPSPDCLPVDDLADCAREALRRDGRTILSYGSTLGYEPLREWIGKRHGVEPGRVVVTNGSLQAFHLVLRALGPGPVAVERPTYDRPRKILLAEGRALAEIPIDERGLDVDAVETEMSAALLYTIPTFQNPSGVTLSEERRRRLAGLVRERGLPVLEDDPYGLVRFEGRPQPSLLELEGGEYVRYSSSFSKTVAPGLRVGYLILPLALASQLQGLAASTYITPGLVAQAALYEFLRRGLFESSLQRICNLLRKRRDAMLEALEHSLRDRARWSRPEGGYFVWLELPGELDASELLTRAEQSGVTFVPGRDFGGEPNTLRLAFSYVSPDQITEGIGRLSKLVASAAAPV